MGTLRFRNRRVKRKASYPDGEADGEGGNCARCCTLVATAKNRSYGTEYSAPEVDAFCLGMNALREADTAHSEMRLLGDNCGFIEV